MQLIFLSTQSHFESFRTSKTIVMIKSIESKHFICMLQAHINKWSTECSSGFLFMNKAPSRRSGIVSRMSIDKVIRLTMFLSFISNRSIYISIVKTEVVIYA